MFQLKPPGATLPGVLFLAMLLSAGCGDLQGRGAYQALTHPFGTGVPFSRGSTQDEVLATWGRPDQIIAKGKDELGNPKEEWVYTGRYPGMPVDYGYVSKTQRLFFEGASLVRWQSEDAPASDSPHNS